MISYLVFGLAVSAFTGTGGLLALYRAVICVEESRPAAAVAYLLAGGFLIGGNALGLAYYGEHF